MPPTYAQINRNRDDRRSTTMSLLEPLALHGLVDHENQGAIPDVPDCDRPPPQIPVETKDLRRCGGSRGDGNHLERPGEDDLMAFSPSLTFVNTEPTSSNASPVFKVSPESPFESHKEKVFELPPNFTQRLAKAVSDRWLYEWGAWTLSLVAFSCLVGVLIIRNKLGLPQWPIGLTINSIVQICVGLTKICLLIPLVEWISQLKWLWFRKKPRPLEAMEEYDRATRGSLDAVQLLWNAHGRHLVSLGVVLMIGSAAIDFFIQQSITYRNGAVTVNQEASLQKLPSLYPKSEFHGVLPDKFINFADTTAIYQGLFKNPTSITPLCSTGNCTWDAFLSLSICSRCTDVSNQITNITLTEMSLASLHNESVTINIGEASYGQNGYPNLNYTTTERHGFTPDPYFGILYFSVMNLLEAYDCHLSFCIQEHNSTVTQGLLVETMLNVWQGQPLNDTQQNLSASEEISLTLPPEVSSRFEVTSFRIWTPAYQALIDDLEAVFDGTALLGADAERQLVPYALGGKLDNDYLNTNLSGIPDLMQSVALSLTNALRQGVFGEAVIGNTTSVEIQLEVSWAWLSFPAALIILTFVFLMSTMIKSKRNGIPPWKSSVNASLFHGLTAEHQGHRVKMDEPLAMERRAKEVRMQLVETQNGWQLV